MPNIDHASIEPEITTLPLLLDTDFDYLAENAIHIPWQDYNQYMDSMNQVAGNLYTFGIPVNFVLLDIEHIHLVAEHEDLDPFDPETWATAAEIFSESAVPFLGDLQTLVLTALARADFQEAISTSSNPQELADKCTDNTAAFVNSLAAHISDHSHLIVSARSTNDFEPPLNAEIFVGINEGQLDISFLDLHLLIPLLNLGQVNGGGIIVRNLSEDQNDTIQGWALHSEKIAPQTAAEVQNAHCLVPSTGDIMPPEPGVTYLSTF